MALLGNSALECRHLTAGGIRTSIALEVAFWQAVERQAAGSGWREWTQERLRRKPAQIGRARWLRVAVLEALVLFRARVRDFPQVATRRNRGGRKKS